MDNLNRPIGPTPGALTVGGMGGPGSGMTSLPTQSSPFSGLLDWLQFQGAGGYGLGSYGYPSAYNIPLGGQQNMMLNRQWGLYGLGHEHQHPHEGFGGYVRFLNR